MRKINAPALLLLLFLLADAAFAQGMLQGVVTTPEGAPLPGACCLYLNQEGLEERIGPQTTRSGGYYRFSNVNPGMYNLEVEIPGYDPLKIPVRVFAAEPTKKDVELQFEIWEECVLVGCRKPTAGLRPVCDPKYTGMHFSEGMGPVKVCYKYGFINSKGDVVIKPNFDKVGDFSEGLAAVKICGKWGYINTDGKFVIDTKFASACPFSGGVAAIKQQCRSNWVHIDKGGEVVDRKEGEKPPQGCATDSFLGTQWKLPGAESRTEKLPNIEEAPETSAPKTFSEGLAKFQNEQGKWGYMNKRGKTVIPPQFDSALDFSEGMAAVGIDGKWGYVNRAGKMVIDLQYDSAEKFSEGLAYVVHRIETDTMISIQPCYVNKKGETIWKSPKTYPAPPEKAYPQ